VPSIGHCGLTLRIGYASMAGRTHFGAGILALTPFSASRQRGEAQNKEREAIEHVTLQESR
jgi:hypothetical protein